MQLIVAEAQLLRDANGATDASTLLERGLGKRPDQPDLLYDLALTAEKLERFDLLERNLRKLIEVKPDHAHAYNALGYFVRRPQQAAARGEGKLIEKALELAPEDYFIIDSLGWVLYREGDRRRRRRSCAAPTAADPTPRSARTSAKSVGAGATRRSAPIWDEALRKPQTTTTLQKTLKRLKN